MIQKSFRQLLELAIGEDLCDLGDVTSQAIFGSECSTAVLHSKDSGVLAGAPYFTEVFRRIDPETEVRFAKSEGEHLSPGEAVAEISGKTLSILSAERIALNFLGYLSGIATTARRFAELQKGPTKVLDTRKTLPGYRELAKYAVQVGGASNHRMGLFDMVMIKDNHIDAAGSIAKAVTAVKERWGSRFTIEVECRSIDEVRQAIESGADIIMLDNMSPAASAEAFALRKGAVRFEASGDMSLEKIADYMEIGLDYISVGRLTHSVQGFDFSLKMEGGT